MLNYIRAEVYKLLRRPYTFVALAAMVALEGLYASMFVFHNAHSSPTLFGEAIVTIVDMGAIGFCTCMLTGDMVFAGQYKYSTLKNEVSFGLSRFRIYLGKLIAQTLLSILYLVVMMGFFLGACALCLPHSAEEIFSDTYGLIIVGYFLAAGLPLWIGAQAVSCMFQFLLQGEIAWSFAYVGVIFVLPSALELFGLFADGSLGELLLKAHEYFPTLVLDGAKAVVGDAVYMGRAWIVGAFWVALSTAVGLYGFYRKEIK